jgi:tRNA (guanine-N7-)-methyltransferase
LFAHEPGQVWLEIGFGGGEHLAEQARTHPAVGLIGCEVFLNGIATLLAQVSALGLGNIRVYPEDARDLLDALPGACLDRVFLLFPDPWPKRRHADRRFIQPANLDLLARLMKPGAEFRVASDDPIYVGWALAHLTRHPAFAWTAQGPADWRIRPADWPGTRYESKALRQGRQPVFLRFTRR